MYYAAGATDGNTMMQISTEACWKLQNRLSFIADSNVRRCNVKTIREKNGTRVESIRNIRKMNKKLKHY
jgi:hypothetical protein